MSVKLLHIVFQLSKILGTNKMSSRYLNRKKKGISPVVATVILVAVAVVIAAALAGFSGSLFSSYSNGPQVKIVSMSLDTSGAIEMVMANSGNSADAVNKISINGIGDTGATPLALAVGANTNPVDISTDLAAGFSTLTEGQQVTATITMQSGSSITQTLTVIA